MYGKLSNSKEMTGYNNIYVLIRQIIGKIFSVGKTCVYEYGHIKMYTYVRNLIDMTCKLYRYLYNHMYGINTFVNEADP